MSVDATAARARLLTFRVGRVRLAVALESVLGVQEVVGAEVASGGPALFRGREVATVHAARAGWGAGGGSAGAAAAAVVLGTARAGPTALIVDRVEGIDEAAATWPLPALVAPFVRWFCRGVALHEDGLRLVVDADALAGTGGAAATEGGRGGPEAA